MIKTRIEDGEGGNRQAQVLLGGELLVAVSVNPPLLPQKTRVLSQMLTVDGTLTGSDDMGVDGSVTPVNFWIAAAPDADRYITAMSFILGYGGTAQLYEFADTAAALTNGVKIAYTAAEGEILIANLKTNYSFMRASLIPLSNNNWQSRGFTVLNDYGYFITIALREHMIPNGVKLDKGTLQRLSVTIQDDCTDADLMNCSVFGFERFE